MPHDLIVKPAAGKHAIEVMALAVEWGQPVTADLVARARTLYEASPSLRDFLPRSENLTGIKVIVGNSGPNISAEPDGLQLSRHNDDGSPTWVLQLHSSLLSCQCLDYERWDSTKPKALELLAPLVDLAAGELTIQAVGLQYQDAFKVETRSPVSAAQQLFRKEARFLNAHICNTDTPWHIYQGWFSKGVSGRVTHNLLNIDVTVEGAECLIRINGQHRLLAMGFEDTQTPIPITSEEISSALDSLHNDNKNVIFSLLSQSVCDQIGLTIKGDIV